MSFSAFNLHINLNHTNFLLFVSHARTQSHYPLSGGTLLQQREPGSHPRRRRVHQQGHGTSPVISSTITAIQVAQFRRQLVVVVDMPDRGHSIGILLCETNPGREVGKKEKRKMLR